MGKKYFLAKIAISLVFFGSLLAGVHRFLFANTVNKCEMTYMYEYPQYIEIQMRDITNSSYGLYVYGEGDLADSYRRGKFRGIPVLFVPGNTRSLGSVAYRKYLESRTKYHFDFFTVDFNEELTALYGGYFNGQVAFVKESITKILGLYTKQKNAPKSVILVGHSMGGMVAKGLFLVPNFDPHSVETVITLATPHQFPVVAADASIVEFYEKVNRFWSSAKPDNVVLASVGGASRDVQVRSGLTSAHDPAINVLTTAIPGAWLSTDHLCLVWCKQVVLALTRSLSDLVDPRTLLPSEDAKWRQNVFRYHLINRYGGKHYKETELLREVAFDDDGDWREVIASQYLMTHSPNSGNVKNTYFMIPLLDNPHKDRLVAIATGLGGRDWVFGCVASTWKGSVRYCTKGINLSDQTVLLPSMGDSIKRKLLHLDLIKVKADGYSHIVFNLPRAEPKASISMDIHRTSDRHTIFPFSPLNYLGLSSVVTKTTVAGAVSHNVTFPDFTKSWQSFRFWADPVAGSHCKALLRKVVAWNSAETEFFLALNRSSTLPAELQLHAPKTLMDGEEKFFSVELITLPGCEYSLSVQFDWIGCWSQIVRFYPTVIVSLVCAILLDCLSRQLLSKSRGQQVPSLLSVLTRMSFWKMFVLPELLGIALGFLDSWKLNLPVADDFALRNEGLGLPLLLFLLGCPAWILCFLVVLVLHALVVFGGNTLHLFVVRYLGGSLGVGTIAAEIVCLGLNKFPFAIAVLLAAVSASTCGAVGLVFGFAICIWKLFQVYEDQLEDFLTDGGEPESKEEIDTGESESSLSILSCVTLLWLCLGLLNVPSFLAWLKYPNKALEVDPSFWTCLAMCFSAGVLWKDNAFSKNAKRLGFISVLFSTCSVLVLLFGLTSLYRINVIIAIPLSILAINQLF